MAAKSIINELYQRLRTGAPIYKTQADDTDGFLCTLTLPAVDCEIEALKAQDRHFQGRGCSKKEAEHAAAIAGVEFLTAEKVLRSDAPAISLSYGTVSASPSVSSATSGVSLPGVGSKRSKSNADPLDDDSAESLESRILESLISVYPRHLNGAQLAKLCGHFRLKSKVNHILYMKLKAHGLVELLDTPTPAWRAAAKALSTAQHTPAAAAAGDYQARQPTCSTGAGAAALAVSRGAGSSSRHTADAPATSELTGEVSSSAAHQRTPAAATAGAAAAAVSSGVVSLEGTPVVYSHKSNRVGSGCQTPPTRQRLTSKSGGVGGRVLDPWQQQQQQQEGLSGNLSPAAPARQGLRVGLSPAVSASGVRCVLPRQAAAAGGGGGGSSAAAVAAVNGSGGNSGGLRGSCSPVPAPGGCGRQYQQQQQASGVHSSMLLGRRGGYLAASPSNVTRQQQLLQQQQQQQSLQKHQGVTAAGQQPGAVAVPQQQQQQQQQQQAHGSEGAAVADTWLLPQTLAAVAGLGLLDPADALAHSHVQQQGNSQDNSQIHRTLPYKQQQPQPQQPQQQQQQERVHLTAGTDSDEEISPAVLAAVSEAASLEPAPFDEQRVSNCSTGVSRGQQQQQQWLQHTLLQHQQQEQQRYKQRQSSAAAASPAGCHLLQHVDLLAAMHINEQPAAQQQQQQHVLGPCVLDIVVPQSSLRGRLGSSNSRPPGEAGMKRKYPVYLSTEADAALADAAAAAVAGMPGAAAAAAAAGGLAGVTAGLGMTLGVAATAAAAAAGPSDDMLQDEPQQNMQGQLGDTARQQQQQQQSSDADHAHPQRRRRRSGQGEGFSGRGLGISALHVTSALNPATGRNRLAGWEEASVEDEQTGSSDDMQDCEAAAGTDATVNNVLMLPGHASAAAQHEELPAHQQQHQQQGQVLLGHVSSPSARRRPPGASGQQAAAAALGATQQQDWSPGFWHHNPTATPQAQHTAVGPKAQHTAVGPTGLQAAAEGPQPSPPAAAAGGGTWGGNASHGLDHDPWHDQGGGTGSSTGNPWQWQYATQRQHTAWPLPESLSEEEEDEEGNGSCCLGWPSAAAAAAGGGGGGGVTSRAAKRGAAQHRGSTAAETNQQHQQQQQYTCSGGGEGGRPSSPGPCISGLSVGASAVSGGPVGNRGSLEPVQNAAAAAAAAGAGQEVTQPRRQGVLCDQGYDSQDIQQQQRQQQPDWLQSEEQALQLLSRLALPPAACMPASAFAPAAAAAAGHIDVAPTAAAVDTPGAGPTAAAAASRQVESASGVPADRSRQAATANLVHCNAAGDCLTVAMAAAAAAAQAAAAVATAAGFVTAEPAAAAGAPAPSVSVVSEGAGVQRSLLQPVVPSQMQGDAAVQLAAGSEKIPTGVLATQAATDPAGGTVVGTDAAPAGPSSSVAGAGTAGQAAAAAADGNLPPAELHAEYERRVGAVRDLVQQLNEALQGLTSLQGQVGRP